MRSMMALALKDLRILVRLRSGLFFTFVWPLIVCVMFGVVFAGQNDTNRARLRVVVVDEDRTPGSRAFIERLIKSGNFAIDESARGDAENNVRLGQRAAFIVVKPEFGERTNRMFYGPAREIEIGSDPARGAESAMLEGLLVKYAMEDTQKLMTDPAATKSMIADALGNLEKVPGNRSTVAPLVTFLGALDTFIASPQPPQPGGSAWEPLRISQVAVVREHREGPKNSFQITFPQGIVWGIIGCVMTFAVSLVSERVRGTFVRLQMAPLTRAQVLGGKALGCFASISILQLLILTMGALVFDVRPTSYALLALACVSASAGFVGFMMMISSLGKTEQAVAGAGWAMLMPMAMIGGAMIPSFVLPSWMLTLGNISPIKWAILALEGAIWRGFSPTEMLLPCAVLLTFGAACFALGVRGLREA